MPTAEDFLFGKDHRTTWANQHLLVLRYVGQPSGSGGYADQFHETHDRDYFVHFFFDSPQSVAAYLEHVSHGHIQFSRRGPLVAEKIYTVQRFNSDQKARTAEQMRADLLRQAAADINFAIFDDNSSGRVSGSELVVIMVAAGAYPSAIVRKTDPSSLVLPGGPTLELDVAATAEGLSTPTDTGSVMAALTAHEVLHVLTPMIDLYGPWKDGAWNTPESLAGKIKGFTHLDPVYKMLFGWARPTVVDLAEQAHLCVELVAPSSIDPGQSSPEPLLLFDSRRGSREFFVFEYRTPSAPGTGAMFDSTIGQHGVAVWHAIVDGDRLLRRPGYLAAPKGAGVAFVPQAVSGDDRLRGQHVDWGPNGVLETSPTSTNVTSVGPPINLYSSPAGELGTASGLWRAEHRAFRLRWIDQSDAGVDILVEDVPPDSATARLVIDRRGSTISIRDSLDALSCREAVTGEPLDTSLSKDDALIYAVGRTGKLVWYRHLDRLSGSSGFANASRERVLAHGRGPGTGWAGFDHVLSGGDGVLYAIKPDGTLVWYRHLGQETGEPTFANDGRETVLAHGRGPGTGWAGFDHVLSGGDGVLYAIKPDGTLVWYRHLGQETGEPTFANDGRETVLAHGRGPGTGWAGFDHVLSGGDGVLYAIKPDGTLVWYRHLGQETGEPTFANHGRETVLAHGRGPGTGWAGFDHVLSGGDGVLYAIKPDGTLVWYRHLGQETGEPTFANDGRETVLAHGRGPGTGWAGFRQVATAVMKSPGS